MDDILVIVIISSLIYGSIAWTVTGFWLRREMPENMKRLSPLCFFLALITTLLGVVYLMAFTQGDIESWRPLLRVLTFFIFITPPLVASAFMIFYDKENISILKDISNLRKKIEK